jgi:ribonuclease E
LIDTDDIYEQAHQFMAHVMPEHAARVKRYSDETPLFSRFQIEHQIESAYARTVNLPSGGAIVIDHTEALVSVDVNSARAIKGGDIEETATRTNLEAADEVARQMRLRDLGGLIVIDFIDMDESRNRRDVENRLRDALRHDRARVQFGTISKFGLMEMSRQRLRPALSEGASIPCPRCGGSGHVRDTESSALQILRIIQEESMKDNTAAVYAQVPVEVASFLLNEKRTEIAKIEIQQRLNVLLVPNKTLETPNYKLERLKHDDPRLDRVEASYKMAEEFEDPTAVTRRSQEPTNKQTPVIKGVLPDAPAPAHEPKPAAPAKAPAHARGAKPAAKAPEAKSGGLWGWFTGLFSSESDEKKAKPAVGDKKPGERGERRDGRSANGRGGRGSRGGRGGDRAERGAEGRTERGAEGRTERNAEGVEARGERPVRGERPERGERNVESREGGRPEGSREGRGPRQDRNRGGRGEGQNGRGEGQPALDNNATPEAQAEARSKARNERMAREERGESTEGNHGNEPREPRGDRAERSEGQGRRERSPRGERNEGQGRRERAPRLDENGNPEALPLDNAAGAEGQAPQTEENGGERRERRSRDRYGRDRRERGDRAPREEGSAEHADNGSTAEHAHVAHDHASSEQAPQEAREPRGERQDRNEHSEQAAQTPTRTGMPRVQSFALPLAEMQAVAQGSGLEWVNSNPESIAAVQAAIAAEPKPVHVPRERPPVVILDEGPLVLVETRKDL